MKQYLSRHPGLASILVNGSWQSGMVVVGFIIRTLYVLALSYFLGPELYGETAFAQTYYLAFLPLILLGMETILPREIGAAPADASPTVRQTFALCMALGLGVVPMATLLLFSFTDEVTLLLLIIVVTLLPRAVQHWSRATMIGFERGKTEALLMFTFRGGEAVIGSAVLWMGGGLMGFAVTHLIIWSLYALTSVWWIHRSLCPLHWRPSLASLPVMLRENFQLTLQFACLFMLLNGTFFFYRAVQPDAALFGAFALAYAAASYVAMFLSASDQAFVPILSRSYRRADGKDRRFVLTASLAQLLLGGTVCLIAAQAGPPLIIALLGDPYAATAALLADLLLWVPFYAAATPLISYLHVRRRQWNIIGSALTGLLILAATIPSAPSAEAIAHSLLYAMMGFYAACILCWVMRMKDVNHLSR